MLFRRIRYSIERIWFCKQFQKKSQELLGYPYYCKRFDKRTCIKGTFISTSIYDVLDNNGMNKLIKKLYILKKNPHYDVSVSYYKSGIRKLDYVSPSFDGRITGAIGTVKFKGHHWLSEISIYYTYSNNSEAIIEYQFRFIQIIRSSFQIHNFVLDCMPQVKKPPYFHTYANKEIIKKANCQEMIRLDEILFADVLQAYICTLFYTSLGKWYKLPIEYPTLLEKLTKETKRELRNCFLAECYEKDDEFLVVYNLNYERFEVTHFLAGKFFPHSVLLSYFSEFSVEMYYKAFYKIEQHELERHMRKYLNSRRLYINSKDIKWLINKQRHIRDQEPKMESALKFRNEHSTIKSNLNGWISYYSGKKNTQGFINYPQYTSHYKELFQQNLEYLNAISLVQNNKIITVVTIATFIATIVGIVVTLITSS